MDNQLPGSQTSTPILVFPTPLPSGAGDISHPILHMVVERVPHKLPFVTVFRVCGACACVCLHMSVTCVHACMGCVLCVCVCVCMRACVRACVCARHGACLCVGNIVCESSAGSFISN